MEFIKEHLGFILTIAITYAIGITIIIVQCITSDTEINWLKEVLDSLVPTTITYVLGCVLVNISELLNKNTGNYVFNIFTCLSVFLYAMIFCIYAFTGFSLLWVILETVFTAGLLWLNVRCYQEKYKCKNHSLT